VDFQGGLHSQSEERKKEVQQNLKNKRQEHQSLDSDSPSTSCSASQEGDRKRDEESRRPLECYRSTFADEDEKKAVTRKMQERKGERLFVFKSPKERKETNNNGKRLYPERCLRLSGKGHREGREFLFSSTPRKYSITSIQHFFLS
jgi:hypothetical protein